MSNILMKYILHLNCTDSLSYKRSLTSTFEKIFYTYIFNLRTIVKDPACERKSTLLGERKYYTHQTLSGNR